jgi:GNAT superfamily N-acetyltransferase
MYNIQEENNLQAVKEALVLGRDHYHEVEAISSHIPYNVSLHTIEALLNAGLLSLVTTREKGQLVGYYASLIAPDFVTSVNMSKEMGIYVKPEHRRNGVKTQMLRAVEAIALARGCARHLTIYKTGHNEELPLKDGYRETERVYEKVLGE